MTRRRTTGLRLSLEVGFEPRRGGREALADAYAAEPFVHLLTAGQQPHTSATLGSNCAHLQAEVDQDSGRILVTSVIDNLGKGAAGQAVQNANLALGHDETAGLCLAGVFV